METKLTVGCNKAERDQNPNERAEDSVSISTKLSNPVSFRQPDYYISSVILNSYRVAEFS